MNYQPSIEQIKIMSANNLILIKETLEGTYILSQIDVDCGSPFEIGEAKDLKEAIKKANDYMEENEVEYGYKVLPQGL